MGNASARIGRHIAAFNALASPEFIARTAAEAADVIEDVLESDLDAGKDAYGLPMARRKDGKPALVGAFRKYVRVDPIGKVVLIRLRGKAPVLHHFGRGRGKDVERRIIPTAGIPVHWLPLLRGAVIKVAGGILEVKL